VALVDDIVTFRACIIAITQVLNDTILAKCVQTFDDGCGLNQVAFAEETTNMLLEI
jgi:hypothetical protein